MSACVLVHVDGTLSDVYVDFDSNGHGKLLGGKVTIIGQLPTVPPVVIISNASKHNLVENSHIIPFPLQNEQVYGEMLLIGMDAGIAHDFTVSDYAIYKESLLR